MAYGQLIPLEVHDNQVVSLHGHLYLWQDSTGKATINEAILQQKNNQFKATDTEEFNSNYTESLHWACFGIKATSQTSKATRPQPSPTTKQNQATRQEVFTCCRASCYVPRVAIVGFVSVVAVPKIEGGHQSI